MLVSRFDYLDDSLERRIAEVRAGDNCYLWRVINEDGSINGGDYSLLTYRGSDGQNWCTAFCLRENSPGEICLGNVTRDLAGLGFNNFRPTFQVLNWNGTVGSYELAVTFFDSANTTIIHIKD